MHLASPTTSSSPNVARRGPAILVKLAIVAALMALVGGAAWWFLPTLSWTSSEPEPMSHVVARTEFIQDVTVNGNVESASNVEIRCEVQSLKSAGTMILQIVPEGTYVEEGDFLVRLDSSWLESDRTKQQITCATSEAAVTEAQNDYETAVIAKREYLEGQYKLEEQKILSEILVAEEEASRSKENLGYSERLAAKGYITKLQLEAERFAVEKAANELESANLKLHVLREFTKQKQLKQLESGIATAKARLDAKVHSHKLDQDQLQLIEEQIEKCTIVAPAAGQVVYANVTNRHGGSEIIIEEGTTVREHQEIIRLPDPRRMQVSAKINEAKISAVSAGMPATIRLDAFPDLELTGAVEEVSDYPAPTSWTRGDVKEYETIVKIDNPPPGLKPGLTAEVKIRVHELEKALQIPVQAILEQNMQFYSVLKEGKIWKPREVQVGWSNDKFVTICDVVKFPTPVLFEFNEHPFCLVHDENRWHSRRVEVVSRSGDEATIEGAPGGVTRAKAVLDRDGQKEQLVFNGQLWALRRMKTDTDSGELVADRDAVTVPVQAAFPSGDKLYCLDTDYQVWAKLMEAEPSRPKAAPKPDPRGPHAGEGLGGVKPKPAAADPGPKVEPPKTAPPAAAKPAAPQATDKPGPPPQAAGTTAPAKRDPATAASPMPKVAEPLREAQVWTAREVTVGAVPDDPNSIGIGLEPGEKVVLNAVAFRNRVKLPGAAGEGRSKLTGKTVPAKSGPDPKSSRQGERKTGQRGDPAAMFKSMDKNSDGKLDKSELPTPMQARMGQIDTNKDGAIDAGEWSAAAARMGGERGKNRERPSGAGQ